ncbi:TRCF domain-containing protein, partial [Chloroflexota bacterium]
AEEIQSLVPEAEVAVAHGQMPEDQLEEVMEEFASGRVDILVCTTIIESGLDLPNVNTIIIDHADKMGLTQLYQLRGRVGRGDNLAYAYLLYDGRTRLNDVAEKRMRTIFEATGLGAGFQVAMKDLEIRGAGTLLGRRQSGYITAVGFNLYCQMLAEAVAYKKGTKGAGDGKASARKLPPPVVHLPFDAYLPESYIEDENTRLVAYQKLANLNTEAEVEDVAREYADRFGEAPDEVNNLLFTLKVKILAGRIHAESVDFEGAWLVIRLFEGLRFTPRQQDIEKPGGVHIGNNQASLDMGKLGNNWPAVLTAVLLRVVE